jgi:hypothetical protein
MWFNKILGPYVVRGIAGNQNPNQSMVGAISRIFSKVREFRPGNHNNHSVQLGHAALFIKALSVALVVNLAVLCRTRTKRRDDARLLGEFSLVVLTMLFVSERSWKHHFVTLLLPYTYLVYRTFVAPATRRVRLTLMGALGLSAILMMTTSDLGVFFANGQGNEIAQFYGMFFWAAVVLYFAVAWRVVMERSAGSEEVAVRAVPPPHVSRSFSTTSVGS